MSLTPFELGILWATSGQSGNKWLLRNEDEYFVRRIQTVNGGAVFPLRHSRKGTIIWTLDIKRPLSEELLSYGYTGRTDENRIFPRTSDDAEFAAAYIQCHCTLDLWRHKSRSKQQVTTPRLRMYGAQPLIERMNNVIATAVSVGIKAPQTHGNGKMKYLTYQSPAEVADICHWIMSGEHSLRFAARVKEILHTT